MIKSVVQNPNTVLHKKADDVRNFGSHELEKLICDMKDTLAEQNGLGLAAPQIVVSKSIFVIPYEYAPRVRTWRIPSSLVRKYRPAVYINPHIIIYSKKKEEMEEGCLSVRGVYHPITRAHAVTLVAQNKNGKKFEVRATGLLARIYQHETDHLNGLLFLDRLHEK
ncbi:MAG: peptide deformylase [Candidatus Spechtbacteria bacterium RIFCSPLOWO2_01_FULL_46_10]|uniref:Peptide deformylase n=1 Tax=Candidatus Spechtbacteria bacterium RIFCSPLOWO2_01_FULL_46_10 TaxID=1802163 RepID=A0A1G2HHB0_9BACT|nr:MAG: peptide deformylase [Candidatus Spechtbacteria bacterium RIFCSPLOWO2_01_FULL_46_10]